MLLGQDIAELSEEPGTPEPSPCTHPELIAVAIPVLGGRRWIEGCRLCLPRGCCRNPRARYQLPSFPSSPIEQTLPELREIGRRKMQAKAACRMPMAVMLPPPVHDAHRSKEPPGKECIFRHARYALDQHAQQMRAQRIVEEDAPRIVGKRLSGNAFGPVIVSGKRRLCVLSHLHGQKVTDRHIEKARIGHIWGILRKIGDPWPGKHDLALVLEHADSA